MKTCNALGARKICKVHAEERDLKWTLLAGKVKVLSGAPQWRTVEMFWINEVGFKRVVDWTWPNYPHLSEHNQGERCFLKALIWTPSLPASTGTGGRAGEDPCKFNAAAFCSRTKPTVLVFISVSPYEASRACRSRGQVGRRFFLFAGLYQICQ